MLHMNSCLHTTCHSSTITISSGYYMPLSVGTLNCCGLRHGQFLFFLTSSSVNFLGEWFECTSLCTWVILRVKEESSSVSASSQLPWRLHAAHSISFFQSLWTSAFPCHQLVWHFLGTLITISNLHF